MITQMSRRQYTLKRRAEQQAQTRRRIVDAAIALHEEVGPKETTISAIAARAQVQRLTVYRHFPDEAAILRACSTRWIELNPPPDPALWRDQGDAVARTRIALLALYRYYRGTARMWERVYRDADLPAVAEVLQEFEAYLDQVREELTAGWSASRAPRRQLRAALRHCVRFSTWQSLAHERLSDRQMTDMTTRWLLASAAPEGKKDARGAAA